MFFAILFLCLAALGSYFFPEWSWAALLGASFGIVVTLRLALLLGVRSGKAADRG